MKKKKMKNEIPQETIIEVQLRKEMTYAEYLNMIPKPMKGWFIRGYQKGFLEPLECRNKKTQ